jgi:hypothetical protein
LVTLHEEYMSNPFRLVIVALLLHAPLGAGRAQQPAAPQPAGGPRLELTAAAMSQPADSATLVQARRTNNRGQPMALMLVGGAALVLGLVIGGDVGTLFSVGGAVAFLYGLYLHLR